MGLVASALWPVHKKLVQIKLELESLLNQRNPHAFSLVQVQMFQDDLRQIDSVRIDGKYISKKTQMVLPGQAIVIDLLERCYEDVHELLAARDPISGSLRPTYESLIAIHSELVNMEQTAKYHIFGVDTSPVQYRLGQIDNMRKDGQFLDDTGACAPGQAILHSLLHKCYRLVYKLQDAGSVVAESLQDIYRQLFALNKCLQELERWNVKLTHHEIIPYQRKLSMIDSLRVNGKFLDATSSTVPHGQAVLIELIESCYEKIRQLQTLADT
jgi:hypothetical protein